MLCSLQRTAKDVAAINHHEKIVAYLEKAADPNMLKVCETVLFKLVVTSAGMS